MRLDGPKRLANSTHTKPFQTGGSSSRNPAQGKDS